MAGKQLLLVLAAIALIFSTGILGAEVDIDDGQYLMTYRVQGGLLYVKVVANTTGYIGWGLSPDGSMSGSDIIIAGYANAPYGQDYAGTGNGRPNLDGEQNVLMLGASENATHTTVEFVRALDTGDLFQDLPIENYNQSIIWALGVDDQVAYHADRRGSIQLNLLEG